MQWVPLMKRIIQLEAGTKLKQMLTIYLSWQRVVSAPDAWWGCSMWKPAACGFMATLMRYVSVYHAPVCCLSTHAPVSPRPAPPRPSILCRTSLLPIWSSVHLLSGHATRDRRHATHATRNSHRTSHTLNIQLFSHLFQIYNCFLCSHTHTLRLKLAFGTWLVLCCAV